MGWDGNSAAASATTTSPERSLFARVTEAQVWRIIHRRSVETQKYEERKRHQGPYSPSSNSRDRLSALVHRRPVPVRGPMLSHLACRMCSQGWLCRADDSRRLRDSLTVLNTRSDLLCRCLVLMHASLKRASNRQ